MLVMNLSFILNMNGWTTTDKEGLSGRQVKAIVQKGD